MVGLARQYDQSKSGYQYSLITDDRQLDDCNALLAETSPEGDPRDYRSSQLRLLL